jgi:multidrug efflux pump subunit AcrB
MSSDKKYISKLTYDPELEKSWFTFFTDKFRVILLFIIVFIVAGIIALRSLPLESTPEVDLGIISINVVLPGASPESVEDLVVKKIEKNVSKVKDIDKMTSTSQNSFASVILQFKTGVDMKKALQDVKEHVDVAKKDFPESAKEPTVNELNFRDTPIWVFSLAGDKTPLELNQIAKNIKDEIEKIPNVSSVNITGGDDIEFTITYDPKKLEMYGLTPDQIAQTIQATNMTIPIGDYAIDGYKHTMNVDNRFYSVQKLRDIAIANIGDPGVILLRDVADVSESTKKRETRSRLSLLWAESVTAVTLSVIKKSGGSIIDLVDAGQAKIIELQASKVIPEDIKVNTTTDFSEQIRSDLHGLTRDFAITLILVCGTLFLFIGLKEALVPTLTIPIVFLLTFVVLKLAGQTLNFLSLFSLVLSLGLLVDDAILIVTGFDQYYKSNKFTARQAMLLALRDLKWPDIATTLTTVWIFAAMLFMTGIIGKFIFSIPFVIMTTLLLSLVLSLTVVPSLTLFFQGDNAHKHGKNEKETFWTRRFVSFEPLIVKYENFLAYLIASRGRLWRFLWAVVGLFLLSVSFPITGLLRTEFFPADNQDIVYINLEAEPGQKLEVTDAQIAKVETLLRKEDPEIVKSFTTTVGGAASTGNIRAGGSSSSTNLASITINLKKKDEDRTETSSHFADRLRTSLKTIQIPGVTLTVVELKGGPPAGADLEVRVTGDDFHKLNKILKDIKAIAETIPGAVNVSTSVQSTPIEFSFEFDTQKLQINGLSALQVASFLKMAIDGVDVTKVFKWSDEIVVRAWYDRQSIDTLSKIKGLKIKNQKGQYVFLGDLMKNSLESSVSSITRIDQKRTVSLTVWADATTNAAELLKEFNARSKDYQANIAKNLKGYTFVIGGVNDENAKSIQSLLISMCFGLLFIVGTIVMQFNSYKQAVLILAPIPLSLIGVFFGLTITHNTLSFPSLIGLVALFGIVVNNSIVIIDKINLNRKSGLTIDEAILDAGRARFEPIFLTSFTTIMGNIPLALVPGTWQSLAITLVAGLTTSGILKLFIVPVLYKLFVKEGKL